MMTFLRIVIPLYLFVLSMIFSENRYPLFRIMLWITLSRTRGKVERIYLPECVRNLTEKEISLKNQGGLKAKSARHQSL
jgi:hypothetical protein